MICRTILSDRQDRASRGCVFLDRDGTLTEYRGYITQPQEIQLCPGAAQTLSELQAAGLACVLVSNQSAIGRGMINEDRLAEIHSELRRQLSAEGASLDAIYWCPDIPAKNDETVVDNADRKPGPGMLLLAAQELNLDLSMSWMVGDRIADILAGAHAGCRGCLRVQSGFDYLSGVPTIAATYQSVSDLREAASVILQAIASQ